MLINTNYRDDGLPDWVDRARPVEQIHLDIRFTIWDKFDHRGGSEPIYHPRLKFHDDHHVFAADVEGPLPELIAYYRDVIRLIKKHNQDFSENESSFWLSPVIYADNGAEIHFAYSDTWHEALQILLAVTSEEDGMLYDDLDQSWRVEIFARGGRLWLRESDWEQGESGTDRAVLACDRKQLVDRTRKAQERTEKIIHQLAVAFGNNYWAVNRNISML